MSCIQITAEGQTAGQSPSKDSGDGNSGSAAGFVFGQNLSERAKVLENFNGWIVHWLQIYADNFLELFSCEGISNIHQVLQ